MVADPPETEQQVLRRCLRNLRLALPGAWKVLKAEVQPQVRADAMVTIATPREESIQFVIELKKIVERRDIPRIKERLERQVDQLGGGANGLLCARYLSPPVRDALKDKGINYIDAAENMRVELADPTLLLFVQKTDTNPWRQPGRPRGTLKGEPAARVVRAILDSAEPLVVSEILRRSGASTGATYRVRDYLLQEGLLKRTEKGDAYFAPDWVKLLREWADDYSITELNTVRTFIAPRGVESLLDKAADVAGLRYAVTGSFAANEWAPYAPARAAMVYVEDTAGAADLLDLRPVEVGQNVVLIEPRSSDSVVFSFTSMSRAGFVLASPSQVAVDLLNGPGRNPAEGEALIEWMRANEDRWRQ